MKDMLWRIGEILYGAWKVIKVVLLVVVVAVVALIGWFIHDFAKDYVTVGDYTFRKGEDCATVVSYNGTERAIVLPEEVEGLPVIYLDNFHDKSGLVEEITIPDCVTDVNMLMGIDAPSLQAYHVADTHPSLQEIGGAVYSRDGKTLYAYPPGRNGIAVIPEGVEHIAENAFCASAASEVVLPQSLRSIGPYALSGFRVLHALEIPTGVEMISEYAFAKRIGEEGWRVRLIVTEGSVAHQFALIHGLTIKQMLPAEAEESEALLPAA